MVTLNETAGLQVRVKLSCVDINSAAHTSLLKNGIDIAVLYSTIFEDTTDISLSAFCFGNNVH